MTVLKTLRGAGQKWRGECLDYFTDVEHALTEVLLFLDSEKNPPMMLGQKFKMLDEHLKSGRLVDQSRHLQPLLEAYRGYDQLRNFVCHGRMRAVQDDKDNTSLILEFVECRTKETTPHKLELTQAKLNQERDKLKSAAEPLREALQAIVNKNTPKPPNVK